MLTTSSLLKRRPIRSFVRREGRITSSKHYLIETILPQYNLQPTTEILPLASVFPSSAPVTLEIGFGNGECLFHQAQTNPDDYYIGIEVYLSGALQLIKRLEHDPLRNIKLLLGDVVTLLPCFPDQSLDCIQIFFPDPWPKTRHHKRRLIQPPFIHQLHSKLKAGGKLYLATDWQPYAEQMRQVVESASGWTNSVESGGFTTRPPLRPLTKFEKRGLALHYTIWDLCFLKQ